MNNDFVYKVFFAIPFDAPSRAMYDSIIEELQSKPDFKDIFQFALGTEVVGPSEEYANIQAFKEQNAGVLEQFFSQISSSDVIVADLTNNNANVHLELGIALAQDKNILRVLARNIVETASDLKGHYNHQYQTKALLLTKLVDYLGMFLKIKRLPLSEKAGPFYNHYADKTIKDAENTARFVHVGNMRDGEVMVKFHMSESSHPLDWFGFFIRASEPWLGGNLVYVRANGSLEVDQMPSGPKLGEKQHPPINSDQQYILHVKFDGNQLLASLDSHFPSVLTWCETTSPNNLL